MGTEEFNQNILPKVCILAAGEGTRLGEYSKFIHKALLPWRGKAILSHIIEKFPMDSEFILALGGRAEQLKSYVKLAHPNLNVRYISVKKNRGEGAGPAQSLYECAPYLTGPFYFVPCDTWWEESFEEIHKINESSWLGVAPISREERLQYSRVQVENGFAKGLRDKNENDLGDKLAFTGLAYFNEDNFFTLLKNYLEKNNEKETQIIPVLNDLALKNKLMTKQVTWLDFGTEDRYKKILAACGSYDFSKTNECIYFHSKKVIKFFADPNVTERRYLRSLQNPKVFPKILEKENGFYSYSFIKGETLYQHFNESVFLQLFSWLKKNLWIPKVVSGERFKKTCELFYKTKTLERCAQLFYFCESLESIEIINGEKVPPLKILLEKIPWASIIEQARAVFFHGDLQPDNILVLNKSEFLLLDWRQDFGGEVDFGDIQYDFAKLLGGVEILYSQIKENNFSYFLSKKEISFVLPINSEQEKIRMHLEEFIHKSGYSVPIIRLLNAIIYCNMAPLHQPPFRELLYSLARLRLNKALNDYVKL